MNYKCANGYYFRSLNAIGGIESHLNYIALKYGSKYDICIFYQDGDKSQIARLRKLVKTVKIDENDTIECVNMFCCFCREVLKQTTAKHKYIVLHGNFKDHIKFGHLTMRELPIEEGVEYLGVSQDTCDAWEELTGLRAKNVYEPVVLKKVQDPLMLISAQRLTKEKGWNRIKKFANILHTNNIPFIWIIYTNSPQPDAPEGIIFHKPILNACDIFGSFDGYVTLTDTEGYGLSLVEAAKRGTPIIATRLPLLEKEMGFNDTNAIFVDYELKDVPIERIKNLKKIKKNMPKYEEPQEKWDEVLDHTKATYKHKQITVRATNQYEVNHVADSVLGYIPKANEEWLIDEERYMELLDFEKRTGIKLVDKVK